ncbi:DnaA-like protein [Litoreibacter meonggei]|uniref:DnaA-like protein n=1 Tax=Litoreibacter meonggei TaxID=1049199 RepID=A0A497UZ23_9RHOB|nr:DnaA N-terminal domain-containing protein [Litoreibacter meonggei]RLJ36320.1 DnaA-like protein [Litoreibacter meonggei]
MELKKLTGPQAGSLKYDLLTALGVAGLHGSPTVQTSLMRLSAMVTARYNWRLDEVSIGQAELARLWAVNERTVKREMKRLTQDGWIMCLRAGVRGRVGAYRLNYARIYENTQACWPAVGPDFADRMEEMSGARRVVKVDFAAATPKVVPLSAVPEGAQGWPAVARRLQQTHPELYESWFAKLKEGRAAAGELNLLAPNAFVAGYIVTHLFRFIQDAAAVEAKAVQNPVPRVSLSSSS